MEREKTVGYVVRTLSNLIKRRLENSEVNRSIEKMTCTHGWIIGYLYDRRNEVVFQRDFETAFNIRRSTVTEMMSLMEKNGLIERVPAAEDKRLKKITLTDKSIRYHEDISTCIEDMERDIVRDIPAEDLENFFRVAEKIKKNIESCEEV